MEGEGFYNVDTKQRAKDLNQIISKSIIETKSSQTRTQFFSTEHKMLT